MIVLDTNVLSELVRPVPDEAVVAWVSARRGDVVTTSITAWELLFGVARLPQGQRRAQLSREVERMIGAVASRLLPLDEDGARAAADLAARREQIGPPISTADALIAGICASRGATLATRNSAGFEGLGLELVNPWLSR